MGKTVYSRNPTVNKGILIYNLSIKNLSKGPQSSL